MASPNTKRDKSLDYSDLYNTSVESLDALFKHATFDKTKTLFEPCAGIGCVSEYFRNKQYNMETNELFDHGYKTDYNLDFLTSDFKHYDIIVSNPPYKLAKKFVLKGFEVATEQYLFLRLDFLASKNRKLELFDLKKLKTVYVFSERVSCTEGKAQEPTTNAVNYAWFHFDNNYNGNPEIIWF